MSKMNVVVVEPKKPAYVKEIDGSLESMNKIVGGYIEIVYIKDNIILVCNEEGKLKGLPFNRIVNDDRFVGNFFVCKSKGEDMVGLSKDELETYVSKYSVW